MKEPKTHYLVRFASRYASTRFKTLNAASALRRADSLVDDAASILELKNVSQTKEIPFGSRHRTFEIVSYFAVGLVTCLEWHARSRLVDIMMFRPSSIQTTDLKNIATLALSQMVTEGATIPHLLGAAVEPKIADLAPKSFPNRVDADGIEEDEFQKLSDEIASLEAEITP
jgi:hypothetical protein